ncbi:hypothetical protein RHGRI_007413 [Rhododendron griersonianum]|uniref:Uncharacterized protein n=1 Tax=Rhododendron griersonianum TaxID=479676 RepID=A0AAV6KXG3_9ERIC|nr:hypothetical protein RHGRI_007413 [Rhododendron griersonianum]
MLGVNPTPCESNPPSVHSTEELDNLERSTNKIKRDNETLIVDLSTNSTPDVSMELEGNIIQSVAEMENPGDIVMETIPTETPIVGEKVIPPE